MALRDVFEADPKRPSTWPLFNRQDICLVRKGYELEGRIKEEAKEKGLKAKVVYWSAAWEIDE